MARSSLPSWSSISLRTASITRSLLRRLRASSSSTLVLRLLGLDRAGSHQVADQLLGPGLRERGEGHPGVEEAREQIVLGHVAEVTAGRGQWQRVSVVGR